MAERSVGRHSGAFDGQTVDADPTGAHGGVPAPLRLQAICPYLVAEEGGWRSATPAPEHRCTAVRPPAAVAAAKQRRLCLEARHVTCATYLAARGDLAEPQPSAGAPPSEAGGGRSPESRWRFAGTTPIVLDRGSRLSLVVGGADRLSQAALVGLIILAFGVLALARATIGQPGTAAASTPPSLAPPSTAPSAASTATASPSPSPSPRPSPTPIASPSPSAEASPAPSGTYRTYRVRAGDTLTTIAARFGTTVKAIAELNGIADPSRIRIGQVLRIP